MTYKETIYRAINFCAIEYVVREVLNTLVKPLPLSKAEMVQKVTNDNDVQFYWLIVTADFEIDDHMIHKIPALNIIVELFLTIWGFSVLTSKWVVSKVQTVHKNANTIYVTV